MFFSKFRLTPANFFIPIVVIITFFLISFSTLKSTADTTDEKFHFTRGIMLLQSGDLRINQHHPYLANLIAAIPALFDKDLQLPAFDSEDWELAKKDELSFTMVDINGGREGFARDVLYGPRAFMLVVYCVLLFVMYYLVRKSFGIIPALVVLLFTAFDPNFIAHSRLITTDVAAMLLTFIVSLLAYKLLTTNKRLSLKHYFQLALFTLPILLTKYSGVFVAVVILIAIYLHTYKSFKRGNLFLKMFRSSLYVTLFGSILTVLLWGTYGFQFGSLAQMTYGNPEFLYANLDSFAYIGRRIPYVHMPLVYIFNFVKFPFPQYVHGFFENVFVHNIFGHDSYFLGEFGRDGWLLYFPVTYLLKTPLVVLGIIGVTLLSAVRKISKKSLLSLLSPQIVVLAGVPILLALLSLNSSLNLGIRHILPIFPFIALGVGVHIQRYYKKYVPVIIAVFLIFNTIALWRVYPHFIPYFNILVGSPSEGYKYVRDSNYHWGQSYYFARDYIERNPDKNIVDHPDQLHHGDFMIIDNEFLYQDPKLHTENHKLLLDGLESGEYKLIDIVANTHSVIKLK